MPAPDHALAGRPVGHIAPDLIDHADHLMTRHPRILNPRPDALFYQRIAVTNSTRLDFHPDPSRLGFRNFPLHNFKRSLCLRDLHRAHFSHEINRQPLRRKGKVRYISPATPTDGNTSPDLKLKSS